MSKKRGASSPNVSEKTKGKPIAGGSAATNTLGMAAVLSAVSHVFSGTSSVTDSEDGNPNQSGDRYESARSETGKNSGNVWDEQNLSQSNVKSPKK